mgnify:CR=1 FL=1
MSIVRAIDVGYGNTKYIKSIDKKGNMELGIFPSIAPRATANGIGSSFLDQRDTKIIDINGIPYEVGPDSKDLKRDDDTRVLHDKYIYSEQYKAILLGALSYMNEPVIDLLVMGLPVTGMKYAEDLKKAFTGIQELDENKTVDIKKVEVLAQPLGALFDYAFAVDGRFEEMKNETNLVIDPGFLTFDFLVTKGTRIIETRSDASPGGMSKVLKSMANSISRKMDISYHDLESIDEGLQKDDRMIKIFGKPVDLNPFVIETLPVLDDAVTFMKNIVGDGMDIDNIILAGGGAHVWKKRIMNQYPNHNLILLDNSVFSVVRGFQKVAEKMIA